MTYCKAKQIIISLLLVLALTGSFTGKNPQYVSGLSPFFSAVGRMEEGVFDKAKESRFQFELAYENQKKRNYNLFCFAISHNFLNGSKISNVNKLT